MIIISIIVGIICAVAFSPSAFGVGVIGTMVVIVAFKFIGAILEESEKKRQEEELNRHALQTIEVTRHIHHNNEGVFAPCSYDEERTEEIIVPIGRK